MRSAAAFTLIELMIALAIAGLLALAALPAWSDYRERVRQAAARGALIAAMAELEQRHATTGHYAEAADLRAPAGRWPRPVRLAPGYQVLARPCDSQTLMHCVEVIAQPALPDAACGALVLRNTGERFTQTAARRQPASPACWP